MWLVILLLLTSLAAAKDLSVNDQEQSAIQQICDVASTNQNIPRDTRAGIAQFCVVWAKKIAETPGNSKLDPPPPPQDTDFDTAYPLPPDCVHVIWIKLNLGDPVVSNAPRLALWKIAGTPTGPVIVVNSQGGPPPPVPPVTPAQVTMYYISNSGPLTDTQFGTPTLILALQAFVMSGIYRGLHEDMAEADKMWLAGEQMLQRARTRYDQQKPKRQFFNSRITAVRRIRRPWPRIGINYWGSGSGSSGIPG